MSDWCLIKNVERGAGKTVENGIRLSFDNLLPFFIERSGGGGTCSNMNNCPDRSVEGIYNKTPKC